MTATKAQQVEREQWIARLRDTLEPGDTVTTVLRHVSASGMSRSIDAYKLYQREDGEIDRYWLSYWIAHAGIGSWDAKREAIRVGGVGMDMGFHIVYSLSYMLFPDGYGCIGERCRSNDHYNGDRDYTPHVQLIDGTATVTGAGHWHRDGGYALNHRWL